MIDRYQFFRQLMDLLADECEITDAKMRNWDDAIEIKASCGDQVVIMNVRIEEVVKDA